MAVLGFITFVFSLVFTLTDFSASVRTQISGGVYLKQRHLAHNADFGGSYQSCKELKDPLLVHSGDSGSNC